MKYKSSISYAYMTMLFFLSGNHFPFTSYNKALYDLYSLSYGELTLLNSYSKLAFFFSCFIVYLFSLYIPTKNFLYISSFIYSMAYLFLSGIINKSIFYSSYTLSLSFIFIGIANGVLFATTSYYIASRVSIKEKGLTIGGYFTLFLLGCIIAPNLFLLLNNKVFNGVYGYDHQTENDVANFVLFEMLIVFILINTGATILDYAHKKVRIEDNSLLNKQIEKKENVEIKEYKKDKRSRLIGMNSKEFWILSISSALFLSTLTNYSNSLFLLLHSTFEIYKISWHAVLFLIFSTSFSLLSGFLLDVYRNSISGFINIRIGVLICFFISSAHILFTYVDLVYITAANGVGFGLIFPGLIVSIIQRFPRRSVGKYLSFTFLLAFIFYGILTIYSSVFYSYYLKTESKFRSEGETCLVSDCYRPTESLANLYLCLAFIVGLYMPKRKKIVPPTKLGKSLHIHPFTQALMNKRTLDVTKQDSVSIQFVDEFAEQLFKKNTEFDGTNFKQEMMMNEEVVKEIIFPDKISESVFKK